MNIFKKLFSKTKIEEIDTNTIGIQQPEIIKLSSFHDPEDSECIFNFSYLLYFSKSYMKDFNEVISTNAIDLCIKQFEDTVFVYFIADKRYKNVIDNISEDNIFFPLLKDVLYSFNYKWCKEYYDAGLLDFNNLLKPNNEMEGITDIHEVILKDIAEFNKLFPDFKDLFTFRDLSLVLNIIKDIKLYDYVNVTVPDMLGNEDYRNTMMNKLYSTYGRELINSLSINKFESKFVNLNIDDLISEKVGEETSIFTLDEDGNLLFDEKDFE